MVLLFRAFDSRGQGYLTLADLQRLSAALLRLRFDSADSDDERAAGPKRMKLWGPTEVEEFLVSRGGLEHALASTLIRRGLDDGAQLRTLATAEPRAQARGVVERLREDDVEGPREQRVGRRSLRLRLRLAIDRLHLLNQVADVRSRLDGLDEHSHHWRAA